MACLHSAGKRVFFGPDLKLTRRFRTMLAAAPGIAPPLNRSLKVLVIADPAPEAEFQLRALAEKGARSPKSWRTRVNRATRSNLRFVSRIGVDECDPVEILALILNEEFDIVHLRAWHLRRSQSSSQRMGLWRDCILSAKEIFRARRVPRLVLLTPAFPPWSEKVQH